MDKNLPNKIGQISKVVDLVFCYKNAEWTLFTVSSLGKQDLILRFILSKLQTLDSILFFFFHFLFIFYFILAFLFIKIRV